MEYNLAFTWIKLGTASTLAALADDRPTLSSLPLFVTMPLLANTAVLQSCMFETLNHLRVKPTTEQTTRRCLWKVKLQYG